MTPFGDFVRLVRVPITGDKRSRWVRSCWVIEPHPRNIRKKFVCHVRGTWTDIAVDEKLILVSDDDVR